MTRPLALFDLDDTLLPIDSDHAWGEFMVALGWVDAAEFRRGNDAFYADYQAGRLDIHAYVEFATAPLRVRGRGRAGAGARALHARGRRAGAAARGASRWSRRTARAATWWRSSPRPTTSSPRRSPRAFGIDELIATAPGARRRRRDHRPHRRRRRASAKARSRVSDNGWRRGGRGWRDFERISVYSDSINDLPLLERATDPVATNPSPGARSASRAQRGWRILTLFA